MPTFLWLRELGCVSTVHATAGQNKGMIALTADGLAELQRGKGIVRLLRHYCCHRFDIPAALQAKDGDAIDAKRHNWGVISKILKDALDFDLSWERRELIISGDVVETVVLLKQIHELVKPHMDLDKRLKEKHRTMHDDKHAVYQLGLLSRPLEASSAKPANANKDDGTPSPDRAWRTNMDPNAKPTGPGKGGPVTYAGGARAQNQRPRARSQNPPMR